MKQQIKLSKYVLRDTKRTMQVAEIARIRKLPFQNVMHQIPVVIAYYLSKLIVNLSQPKVDFKLAVPNYGLSTLLARYSQTTNCGR